MSVRVSDGMFRVYWNGAYVACFRSFVECSAYIMAREAVYGGERQE